MMIFNVIFILYSTVVGSQCWVSFGMQQSDSVKRMHISILSQIPFPCRLLQTIEQSPLCHIQQVLIDYNGFLNNSCIVA